MNAAIIDTDVISVLFKGDSRPQPYRVHMSGRLLGISYEFGGVGTAAAQVPLITNIHLRTGWDVKAASFEAGC